MRLVDTDPGESYAFATSATLDGVTVRCVMRWLPRISRWTCRVTTPDGLTDLTLEQVIQPGGRMLWDRRLDTVPGGWLVWTGPDDYVRGSLGDTLQLVYVEESEL